MENPLLPREAVILEKRRETADTWTFSLAFRDKENPSGQVFLPGQFNMVGLWGVGEVPLSFSGPSSGERPFLHTLRAVGQVTQALVGRSSGDRVWVRGPYGNPWPMELLGDRDLLIVAGGIGLAPLRPVIEGWIDGEGGRPASNRRMTLLYGARTPADLLFAHDLDRWRGHPRVQSLITVDRSNDAAATYRTGVVTVGLDDVGLDPAAMAAFVCGSEIMMRLTALELRKRGFADDRIYVSLERHMKCAVGQCGHCLFGPYFVCKDGPVFRLDALKRLWGWGM